MDKQVIFTFTISDPDLDGEDIFEQVQMLMYEEFHERADVSYGPPDELVNGDEVLADALARIKRDLTPAQPLNAPTDADEAH